MPIVNIPGVGQVNFPDSMNNEDIVKAIQTNILPKVNAPQAQAPTQPTDADSPFLGSLKSSFENLKGEGALVAGKVGITDIDEAAKYRADQKKLAEQIYTPTEQGFTEAPFTKFKELAGSSIPYMVAPLAAGVATLALPETLAVGALGSMAATGTASALQFTGTNLARQMDENNETLQDTSLRKAGAAAIPQAALDVVGFRMIPGIRRIFGKAGKEITEEAALEAAKRGILAKAGQYSLNTGKIMGVEGATEAGQQFLERLQAGLSVTDSAARDEYLQSFIGGAVLGGAFSIPGQAVEKVLDKRAARKQEQLGTRGGTQSLFDELDADDALGTKTDQTTNLTADQTADKAAEQERLRQAAEQERLRQANLAEYQASLTARFGDTPFVRKEMKRAEENSFGDSMIDPASGFPRFAGVRTKEAAQQEFDEASAQVNAAVKSGSEAEYDIALERLKKARVDLGVVNRGKIGAQAPLFAQQQGLDFNQETTAAQTQTQKPSVPKVGQQGLDFTQDLPSTEYTAPKANARSFGLTTETSVAPLQQFLSQIKPRSTSDVERAKQQAALFGVRDENNQSKTSGLIDKISELYEDTTPEEAGYFKGVIDSFFDNYAGVLPKESTDAAFANLNNLSAEDQVRTLKEHTALPDLTTYEGVKKLSDAFDDHVAEAQLAGLGITRASSAYRQMDPAVRSLRTKPKASYDAADQSAFDYFDTYNLDTALRAAAFDIATNTPRNQLFRGQGKEAAENFNEWLLFNTPKKIQYQFDQYVKAYKKQNKGYQAFQTALNNAEAEAKYVESYTGTKKSIGINQVNKGPLHPVIVERIRNNDLQGALKLLARTSKSPYERTLAAKLASLELRTTIGVDSVEVLANDYVDQTNDLVGRFAQGAALYFPDIPNIEQSILDSWNNPKTNYSKFHILEITLDRYEEKIKELKLDMGAFDQVIKDLRQQVQNVTTSFSATGVYFPLSNSISINTKIPGSLSPYILLHETMHAATSTMVSKPDYLSISEQKAVAELKTLFEYAKANAKGIDYYGLNNIDEFIAEAFTNKSFQQFLQGIKYKSANTSLFDKFVEYCLNLFGYDNVLSSTIANVNVLFDSPIEDTYVVAPPLYAKRNDGMFESNSAERSKPFAILTDIVKNVKSWDDVKSNLADAIFTMNTEKRNTWLKVVTVRQMDEMIGTEFGLNQETGKVESMSRLPQISKYMRLTEQARGERDKVITSHTIIARKLLQLQKTALPTLEKLNSLVQFATVNEVDPGKVDANGNVIPFQPKDPTKLTDKEKQQAKASVIATRVWNELGKSPKGKEAQALYTDMRDFFAQRLAEFKSIAYVREENRMLAEAGKEADRTGIPVDEDIVKQKAKEKVDASFSDKIEPYFPLKRFGKFWVRVGKGKDRTYMQFEDARAKENYLNKERAKYAQQLRSQGRDDAFIAAELAGGSVINHGNSLPELSKDVFSSKEVFDEVLSIVNTGGKDITDVEELRALMEDQLGELYVTTLPLQSIKRMFLHRQNVQGASGDLIRSFQHAAMHMAYQHARFKYSPQLEDQLSAADSRIKLIRAEDVEQANVLTDYLNAVRDKYNDTVRTPTVSPAWVNKASSVNFFWFLTAPASALVNIFAIPNIALPMMGGKYGVAKSSKSLIKYTRKLGSAGFKNLETGEVDAPTLRRAKGLSALEVRAFNAVPEGMFEQSLAHDAATLGENPSTDYSGRWGRIMEIATFPFHKAERFNREVTYMAIFDLAYKKNGGDFNAAVKEASDLTYKVMFDYATENKSKIMQGNYAKVILAFKQYPQHYTYLLLRTAFEATRKVSDAEYNKINGQYGKEAADKYRAETDQISAEALKSFMLMMGMTFLFAGTSGLPLWWLYEGMANAFNAVFGDDKEPYDANNEFKNKMTQVFGGFTGDSISRGVIPQLTGLSLSDRMSANLPDLWFRDVKNNQDEVQYAKDMIISLLGPTVGIGINAAEAVKRFNDGHIERAAEALAPAVFKNILSGTRLAREGALTMKGETLIENISGPEAFKQMLGFTPERLAQRQAANMEAKSREQKVLNRKQDLLNFLAMAIDNEDTDAEDKVLAKIDEFNEANDWAAIKGSTIRSSLKKRAKNRAMADETGGMNFNKNFRDIAEDMTEYAEDEEDEE